MSCSLYTLLIKNIQKHGKYTLAKKQQDLILSNLNKDISTAKKILQTAILKIMPPILLKKQKYGSYIYKIPVEASFRKSISLAIKWILKNTKRKKICFVKAFVTEILFILQNQGTTYQYYKLYLKEALKYRVYSHILKNKKRF